MVATVILRHQGAVRHYNCETYFDAVVLLDALSRCSYDRIELWKGAVLETEYVYAR
jgi:hypothetical protein